MRLEGLTPKGERVALGAPIELTLRSDEDAPADDVTALLPAGGRPPVLAGLRVLGENGALLLEGPVDEQRLRLDGGATLELTARSRGAQLLDNQAEPQVYRDLSLPLLFERHVRPYGFSGWLGDGGSFTGELRVEPGMSEWAVVEAFCRDWLRVVPRLTAEGTLDASGIGRGGPLRFCNWGGLPYFSLEERRRPCDLLSSLRVRTGPTAGYGLELQSERAVAWGVRRRRFWDAAQTEAPAQRGEEILRRSEKRAWRLVLRCPGVISAPVGSPVSVEDEILGLIEGLTLCGKRITADAQGCETQVELR